MLLCLPYRLFFRLRFFVFFYPKYQNKQGGGGGSSWAPSLDPPLLRQEMNCCSTRSKTLHTVWFLQHFSYTLKLTRLLNIFSQIFVLCNSLSVTRSKFPWVLTIVVCCVDTKTNCYTQSNKNCRFSVFMLRWWYSLPCHCAPWYIVRDSLYT